MSTAAAGSSARAPRVLITEDAAEFRLILSPLLRKQGFLVYSADTGEAALDMVRKHEPDLVLLDVGLPGISGIEVCRRVREFSDTYIMMVTAQDQEQDKLDGFEAGADDYITKPFSPAELVARVRAVMSRAPLR